MVSQKRAQWPWGVGGCVPLPPSCFPISQRPLPFVICCFLNSEMGCSLLCCRVGTSESLCMCLLEGLPSFTLEEPLLLTAWASVTDVILEWRKCPGEPEILRNCLEPVGTQRRLVREGTYPRPGPMGAGAPRPPAWVLHPSSLSLSLCGPSSVILTWQRGRFPKCLLGRTKCAWTRC